MKNSEATVHFPGVLPDRFLFTGIERPAAALRPDAQGEILLLPLKPFHGMLSSDLWVQCVMFAGKDRLIMYCLLDI